MLSNKFQTIKNPQQIKRNFYEKINVSKHEHHQLSRNFSSDNKTACLCDVSESRRKKYVAGICRARNGNVQYLYFSFVSWGCSYVLSFVYYHGTRTCDILADGGRSYLPDISRGWFFLGSRMYFFPVVYDPGLIRVLCVCIAIVHVPQILSANIWRTGSFRRTVCPLATRSPAHIAQLDKWLFGFPIIVIKFD